MVAVQIAEALCQAGGATILSRSPELEVRPTETLFELFSSRTVAFNYAVHNLKKLGEWLALVYINVNILESFRDGAGKQNYRNIGFDSFHLFCQLRSRGSV